MLSLSRHAYSTAYTIYTHIYIYKCNLFNFLTYVILNIHATVSQCNFFYLKITKHGMNI